MDGRLLIVDLVLGRLQIVGRELAQYPLDVHELLAMRCSKLFGGHLRLVPAQDFSVRQNSWQMIREHNRVRTRETHRGSMLT